MFVSFLFYRVHSMIEKLAQFTDIRCCLIVGGLSTKVCYKFIFLVATLYILSVGWICIHNLDGATCNCFFCSFWQLFIWTASSVPFKLWLPRPYFLWVLSILWGCYNISWIDVAFRTVELCNYRRLGLVWTCGHYGEEDLH